MESHNDKLNSIRKLSAAYKSMYEPKPEPEVNTEEEKARATKGIEKQESRRTIRKMRRTYRDRRH